MPIDSLHQENFSMLIDFVYESATFFKVSTLLHIIFVIPMIVNDVNLSIAFRGVTVA
jgi:hypothetical protein